MASALGFWLRDQIPLRFGACGTSAGTALSVVWGVAASFFSATALVSDVTLGAAVADRGREKARSWRESWKVARLDAGNIVAGSGLRGAMWRGEIGSTGGSLGGSSSMVMLELGGGWQSIGMSVL
jgi:hypothetical protein